MRKTKSGFFSIEKLFNLLRNNINEQISTDVSYVFKAGGSPRTIWINIFKFKKKRDRTIYHITGDVHYMALATGKRTVLTIHDVNSATNRSFLKQIYIKLCWFWLPALFVKRISVISEFTKDELVKLIPFAKKKIRVVPNPVDPDITFQPKSVLSDQPIILFIGTKVNKNLERCIAAMNGIHAKLQVIGKLSDKQTELLKKNGINFTNVFGLSDEEIKKAYQDCDIVCFPSTYEGFGMPIIEAQATGRPVITSNIGAMKEVARDSVCFIDPYSIQSIREGIEKVIRDDQYRKSLVEKGKKNIKRFEVSTIAKKYIEIYNETLTA